MSFIDLNFEILEKEKQHVLQESIKDKLDLECININNPLIDYYLNDFFNKKYQYKELKIEDETDSEINNTTDSDSESIQINRAKKMRKRIDTPIIKRNKLSLIHSSSDIINLKDIINDENNNLIDNDKVFLSDISSPETSDDDLDSSDENDFSEYSWLQALIGIVMIFLNFLIIKIKKIMFLSYFVKIITY